MPKKGWAWLWLGRFWRIVNMPKLSYIICRCYIAMCHRQRMNAYPLPGCYIKEVLHHHRRVLLFQFGTELFQYKAGVQLQCLAVSHKLGNV